MTITGVVVVKGFGVPVIEISVVVGVEVGGSVVIVGRDVDSVHPATRINGTIS
jgi:hypothetical protein